jgi:hypothetical protein
MSSGKDRLTFGFEHQVEKHTEIAQMFFCPVQPTLRAVKGWGH